MNTFPITRPIIVLVGPTAIGKTDLSLELAEKFNCEIISMDSMQVYRYMNIGTAKVSLAERERVPHHLIDIVNPDEDYDAKSFVDDSLSIIKDIHSKNKVVIITGGTGLYLKSLTEGLFKDIGDYPDLRKELRERLEREGSSRLHKELEVCDCLSAKRIHANDSQRMIRALEIYHGTGIPWSEHLNLQKQQPLAKRFTNMLQIGLTCERDQLYDRINFRTKSMITGGLVEEVSDLLGMGYTRGLKSMSSIGYRHAINYLEKNWDKVEMEELLARDTRRYAKRQYTWFNKNKYLNWMEVSQQEKILQQVTRWLESTIE